MDFDDIDDLMNINFDDEELSEEEIEALKKLEEKLEEPFVMVHHKSMFYPAPLRPGDKVAILSPASDVKDEYVLGAMTRLMERGYEPVLMPNALGHCNGSFAATKGERLTDLFDALENPEFKAIFCTRGGYGCCQLLANFSYGMVARNPKWIVGFSDISALLALWWSSDIASIHGPMAKHLSTQPENDPSTEALFDLLAAGGRFDYTIPAHPYNRHGNAKGEIRGGNLAVLTDLAGTPEDMLNTLIDRNQEGVILFFEDIAEPIYKVNRMIWRLILSGSLIKVKGIIFGQFTEYKGDKNFDTMEDMLKDLLDRSIVPKNIPVVFNFPVGHTDFNLPITVGAKVELEVTENSVRLHTVF